MLQELRFCQDFFSTGIAKSQLEPNILTDFTHFRMLALFKSLLASGLFHRFLTFDSILVFISVLS